MNPPETPTLQALRSFLLLLFLFGLLGVGAELVLLDHVEDFWQWTPLALMGLSLAVLGWHAVDRSRRSLRAFQGTMLLCVISGFAGMWLHFEGNVAFERETRDVSDPGRAGVDLGGAHGGDPRLGTRHHLERYLTL